MDIFHGYVSLPGSNIVGPRPLDGRCVLVGWGGAYINVHVNLSSVSVGSAMSRGGNDRSGWGHWNELIGPGDGPAAPPGQYQIGDNIPWDRLGPMVPRPTTYRKRMEELEHALTFKGDLEIMQWIMVNLRTSASLMSITCTYWGGPSGDRGVSG